MNMLDILFNKGIMENLKLGLTLFHCLSEQFNDQERNAVCTLLMSLVNTAFKGVDITETRSVVFGKSHNIQKTVYFIVKDGRDIIGFCSCRDCLACGQRVLYRSGTIISPEFQGLGLYKLLIGKALRSYHQFIALETQNPRVMASVINSRLFINVWPNKDLIIPPHIQAMVYELKKNENIDGMIERNSAKEPMFSELPLSKEEWVNNFFKKNIGHCDKVFIIAKVL